MPFGLLMSEFGAAAQRPGALGSASQPAAAAWPGSSHDSTVSVATPQKACVLQLLKTGSTPLSVVCLPENSVMAAGHDSAAPCSSSDDRGCLTFVSKLDIPKQSVRASFCRSEPSATWTSRPATEVHNHTAETLHQNSITQYICEVDKQHYVVLPSTEP